MSRTRSDYIKRNEPDSESEILFSLMYQAEFKKKREPKTSRMTREDPGEGGEGRVNGGRMVEDSLMFKYIWKHGRHGETINMHS